MWILWCTWCRVRIRRRLHSPARPPAQHSERVVDSKQNSRDAPCANAPSRKQREGRRFQTEFSGCSTHHFQTDKTFHAPALSPAQDSDRLIDSKENSKDAPRASAATRPKQSERVVDSRESCQDPSRASVATRPKQRVSCRFQREFSGCSTHHRHCPAKTASGSSIPKRILRTLHAPAPPVVDSKQNSQDVREGR